MKNKQTGWSIAGGIVGLAAAGTWLYFRHRPSIPQGVEALKPFDLRRFLGKWYEICRMPTPHEKWLTRVTSDYSWNPDGSVRMVDYGFDEKKNRWYKTVGRMVSVGNPDDGKLKISFFRPFYTGFNVIAIDGDYRYALIFGRSHDSMWILSREPDVPEEIRRKYIEKAAAAGYDYYRLIWTEQEIY